MIPINELKQTCIMCPSQWEFRTFENRPGYARYRWGGLSVHIGDPNGDIWNALNHPPIIDIQIGDEFDGVVGWEEIIPHIEQLTESEILELIKEYNEI